MPSIADRIKDIELEMNRTQKNKATEHHIGLLKARLSMLRKQLMEQGAKSGGKGEGFDVARNGDARVAMIGFPSVGKSSLLNHVCAGTKSDEAAHEFTTLTCIPGVLQYGDARIQILDLPGIIEGASKGKGRGRQVIAVARSADLVLMMVDAVKGDVQVKLLTKELWDCGIRLNQKRPDVFFKRHKTGGVKINKAIGLTRIDDHTIKTILHTYKCHNCELLIREDINTDQLIDVIEGNRKYLPCLYVYNKIDNLTIEELDPIARRTDHVVTSIKLGLGVQFMLERIWFKLDMIRVYTKPKGGPPDLTEPVIFQKGSTIRDVCNSIHKDFLSKFKYAQVWGRSAKHRPQTVGVAHVLQDGDVVQLITNEVEDFPLLLSDSDVLSELPASMSRGTSEGTGTAPIDSASSILGPKTMARSLSDLSGAEDRYCGATEEESEYFEVRPCRVEDSESIVWLMKNAWPEDDESRRDSRYWTSQFLENTERYGFVIVRHLRESHHGSRALGCSTESQSSLSSSSTKSDGSPIRDPPPSAASLTSYSAAPVASKDSRTSSSKLITVSEDDPLEEEDKRAESDIVSALDTLTLISLVRDSGDSSSSRSEEMMIRHQSIKDDHMDDDDHYGREKKGGLGLLSVKKKSKLMSNGIVVGFAMYGWNQPGPQYHWTWRQTDFPDHVQSHFGKPEYYSKEFIDKIEEKYSQTHYLSSNLNLAKHIGKWMTHFVHFTDIAIHPLFRGKGLGTQLCQSIIYAFPEQTKYGLEVESTNIGAIRCYAKCGFEIVRVVDDYYGPGRHAYKMTLVSEFDSEEVAHYKEQCQSVRAEKRAARVLAQLKEFATELRDGKTPAKETSEESKEEESSKEVTESGGGGVCAVVGEVFIKLGLS